MPSDPASGMMDGQNDDPTGLVPVVKKAEQRAYCLRKRLPPPTQGRWAPPTARIAVMGLTGVIAVFALLLCSPWAVPPALDCYGGGAVLTDRHGRVLRIVLTEDEQDNRPVALATVSPWVGPALIAAEDKRFAHHPGIDPLAILRAIRQNLTHRRRISGASTISTQVIRLARPRSRTLATKGFEALQAIRMERYLPKDAILEQHLNRAPFGGNLTGIESASRLYFNKSAAELTLAESALLVGLPQSPARLRPDRHAEAARKRMLYVLSRMEARGVITPAQRAAAERQPMRIATGHRPFEAPHFCDFILHHHRVEGTVRTTLDQDLQREVERVANRHTHAWRQRGIHGAAVVVLEVETGAVRALLGSPDYFDPDHAGMVNAAVARRSPGSALKPFIYAMALDQGIITPGSTIQDQPLRFRDHTPSNFDGQFRGPVTVREALILSLNIPALTLTRQVGLHRALVGLRELGLETLDRAPEHYGLGLALGGGECRLLDLVNAYACLAREGRYKPYRVLEPELAARDQPPQPAADGQRIYAAETAYMLNDMLSGHERSQAIFGHMADARLPRIAWKTGTSSDFRDAWTIAWNPDYVVGVWAGNLHGGGAPGLVGAEVAAPLAGDIFRLLPGSRESPWFARPEGLRERHLADGSRDWYVPGISVKPQAAMAGEPPVQIITPANGATYRRLAGSAGDQSLALQAAASGHDATTELHWFANGAYVGASRAGAPLYWDLQHGDWTIVCSDRRGGQDHITIRVE